MTFPEVCRPSASERLLLVVALGPRESVMGAWKEWTVLARASAEPLDAHLLPLASRTIRSEDRMGARVTATLRESWLATERLLAEAEPVLARFDAEGIPVLALKGLALGLRYYGGTGPRPLTDLDLLVPAERFADARHALATLGWTAALPEPPERLQRFFHGHPFTCGPRGQIDLHRHVVWQACSPGADAPFWEGSEPFEVAGHPLRCLCPADELFHAVVHGVRWYRKPAVRWIADACLVVSDAPDLDWDRLLWQGRRLHVVSALRDGLTYLAEEWGAAVPAPALESLRSARVTRRDRVGYEARLTPDFSENVRPSIDRRWHERWPTRLLEYLEFLGYDLVRCVGPLPGPRDLLDYLDLVGFRMGIPSRRRTLAYFASLVTRRSLRTLIRGPRSGVEPS
jgi:hypothetical protein